MIEVVPAGDAGIELELFTAEQRRELLEEVIGRTVVLRRRRPPERPGRPTPMAGRTVPA